MDNFRFCQLVKFFKVLMGRAMVRVMDRIMFRKYSLGALRGQGVLDLGMVKIEFDVVFDRGQCKLPDAFYGIKK